MKKLQNTQGFTIIETSLVLPIAGLILVMAFVALPALQRQTRDAKRKEDAATFMQALTKYQENNRGQLPAYTFDIGAASVKSGDSESSYAYARSGIPFNTSWDYDNDKRTAWRVFYKNYLGEGYNSPEGERYRFLVLNCTNDVCGNAYVNSGSLISQGYDGRWADFNIFVGAVCNGSGWLSKSSNSRNVAIVVPLEGGGSYCIDN